MTIREKRWRRFYLFLMLFIYVIYVPFSFLEWIFLDGKIPFVAILIGVALPFMRKNHLNNIQSGKEEKVVKK